MGYPKELDEFTTPELEQEVDRRLKLRQKGLCDYCGRKPESTACRFPDRHAAPAFGEPQYRA